MDFLTGIINRRGLVRRIEAEMDGAIRHDLPFSLILFDLDDFKKINDQLGHDVGDLVLRDVASLMTEQLRKNDSVGRWGGEEFILILPYTHIQEAGILSERIRQLLSQQALSKGARVSASFGVAEYRCGESLNELIRRVDQAQYRAKQSKNCVVLDENTVN